MKIGSIGRGMVGEAIFQALHNLKNEMTYSDPRFPESKIEDILYTDVVFISVPTLPNDKNECDLTILIKVLDDLSRLKYNGHICIKSTITPGTTQHMIDKYKNDKICFCPEFLRERCAYEDFMENNSICVVGTISNITFELIKKIHEPICREFKMVSPVEAELTKYMQNVYNTYRVLFANGMYEICKHNNVEYNSVLESLLVRKEMDSKYMQCDENMRGPSGPCLVKDSLAFNQYVNSLNLLVKPGIFQTIVDDMELYPKTVIDGTRTEKEYFGKELHKK
jgi:nucleotide sugar dehydrogenase